MKNKEGCPTQTYQNIMEILVQEEIERQLEGYPVPLAQYINQLEVATYALNRLPPLYASSQKGKQQQKLLAYQKFRLPIKASVRQGLAAVQRDPLRVSTPLISEAEAKYQQADAARQALQEMLEEQDLLDYQEISWDNLVRIVKRALNKKIWTKMNQQLREPISPVNKSLANHY